VDASGNVYVADASNNRVRIVTRSTGIIATYAGTGVMGSGGDGMAATSAQLNNPQGVAVDASGNVFIADSFNKTRCAWCRRPQASSRPTRARGRWA